MTCPHCGEPCAYLLTTEGGIAWWTCSPCNFAGHTAPDGEAA